MEMTLEIPTKKKNIIWTKEKCLAEAIKFNTRTKWANGSATSYQTAKRNGWFGDCTKHMTEGRKLNGYWTKERCLEDALKYKKRGKWRHESVSAATAALKNGWYEECTKHMPISIKPNGYWAKEKCLEDALKYTKKSDWRNASSSAATVATKNGWYEECTKHMTDGIKPSGYWTKERCLEDALKYTKRSHWKNKSKGAINAATKNGWYEECTKHMPISNKPNGYWTKEKCLEAALKYTKKSDWRNDSGTSFQTAKRNGWLGECMTHMTEK